MTTTTRFAILEAPSVLGLFPRGNEEAPAALLRAGLAQALGGARVADAVEPPAWRPEQDPATGLRNGEAIAAYSAALADAVGELLDAGEFPVVLGGDCSILLGCLLAPRRAGRRAGLLFLDGHGDFWTPGPGTRGEAASSDLLLATGRGPALLADLEGLGPLVRDGDVAALGRRDGDEYPAHPSPPLPDAMLRLDLAAVRRLGAAKAGRRAAERLARPGLDGFWVHLDADVLDDGAMPAVDYRMPGGLAPEEVADILRAAAASGRALGLDATIYNPRRDPDGRAGRVLADCIALGLAGAR